MSFLSAHRSVSLYRRSQSSCEIFLADCYCEDRAKVKINVLLNVGSGVLMLKQAEESFFGVSDSTKPKVKLHNSVRWW